MNTKLTFIKKKKIFWKLTQSSKTEQNFGNFHKSIGQLLFVTYLYCIVSIRF